SLLPRRAARAPRGTGGATRARPPFSEPPTRGRPPALASAHVPPRDGGAARQRVTSGFWSGGRQPPRSGRSRSHRRRVRLTCPRVRPIILLLVRGSFSPSSPSLVSDRDAAAAPIIGPSGAGDVGRLDARAARGRCRPRRRTGSGIGRRADREPAAGCPARTLRSPGQPHTGAGFWPASEWHHRPG